MVLNKGRHTHISVTKFGIPWLLLAGLVVGSIGARDIVKFGLETTTSFILDNFGWLFNITTLGCLALVAYCYYSRFGKIIIGGRDAQPTMRYSSLIGITLCTIIAAGILFWACAEPLYHYYEPGISSGIKAATPSAAIRAMETIFLEWTWSPYALYTTATIILAFAFHNMQLKKSISSALVPLFGLRCQRYTEFVDIVCLFSLGAGMAASLGTGTITIAGGLENQSGIRSSAAIWLIIIVLIVSVFIVSSLSGIMKGIRVLSRVNIYIYFILIGILLIFAPLSFILNFSVESWGQYIRDFIPLSLGTGAAFGDTWFKSWPIFYWCNWLAWTPITAVFLGTIAKGHSVRRIIQANLIIPALFSTVWMSLFSASTLFYEMNGANFWAVLQDKGPESTVYLLFNQMPLSSIVIPFYLFIAFISFVTASDSNTTAVADICSLDNNDSRTLGASLIKILWGVTIGGFTYILLCTSGIEGIKMASNLGGFPNLFLMILMAISLFKVAHNPERYDESGSSDLSVGSGL